MGHPNARAARYPAGVCTTLKGWCDHGEKLLAPLCAMGVRNLVVYLPAWPKVTEVRPDVYSVEVVAGSSSLTCTSHWGPEPKNILEDLYPGVLFAVGEPDLAQGVA